MCFTIHSISNRYRKPTEANIRIRGENVTIIIIIVICGRNIFFLIFFFIPTYIDKTSTMNTNCIRFFLFIIIDFFFFSHKLTKQHANYNRIPAAAFIRCSIIAIEHYIQLLLLVGIPIVLESPSGHMYIKC